jgi:hypothetical protein
MRRITQNTISDRVLGIRRDRQGIAVVSVARCMTVLLGFLCKHAGRHFGQKYYAFAAWISAWMLSSEAFRWQQPSRQFAALACPAPVEVVSAQRC